MRPEDDDNKDSEQLSFFISKGKKYHALINT